MKEKSDFHEWRRSLQWSEAKNAFVAPDGSLWELENEEEEIYAEVSSASEQEVQSKLESGW
jgi:hypothetical protein